MTFTVLAAATAIVAGTAVALLGFVFPDLGADAASESEPLPSGVDRVADLPVVPTVLVVRGAWSWPSPPPRWCSPSRARGRWC